MTARILVSSNLAASDWSVDQTTGRVYLNTNLGSTIGNAVANTVAHAVAADLVRLDLIASNIAKIDAVGAKLSQIDTAATNSGTYTTVNAMLANIASVITNLSTIIGTVTNKVGSDIQSAYSVKQSTGMVVDSAMAVNAYNQSKNFATQAIAAYAGSTQLSTFDTLAAMTKPVHGSNSTVACNYDTSRDSDAGNWRYAQGDKSWQSEMVGGNWLGEYTNEVAARIAAGNGNLVYSPNDFTNGIYSLQVGGNGLIPVITPNQGVTADGSTGTQVTFYAPDSTSMSILSVPITVPTTTVQHACGIKVKASTSNDIGKILAFRGVAGGSYITVTLTNSWQTVSTVESPSATSTAMSLALRPAVGTSSGTVNVLVSSAQCNAGPTLAAYVPDSQITGSYYTDTTNALLVRQLLPNSGYTTEYRNPRVGQWLPQTYFNEMQARQAACGNLVYTQSLNQINTWANGYYGRVVNDGTVLNNQTFWAVKKTVTATSEGIQLGVGVLSGNTIAKFTTQGIGSCTQLSFGLYTATDQWTTTSSICTIVSGPGAVTQISGGLWKVTGLSTSTPTTITVTRLIAYSQQATLYFYPDTHLSSTIGNGVYLNQVGLWSGTTVGTITPDAQYTGMYYYDAGSASYRMFLNGLGTMAVTRGGDERFPQQALISFNSVANILSIHDGSKPGLPMWMVFRTGGTYHLCSANVTSIKAKDGEIVIATNGTGAYRIRFVTDKTIFHGNGAGYECVGSISQRNAGLSYSFRPDIPGILSNAVYACDITTLQDAPLNLYTNLPEPTLGFGTDTGISVVKHDGTVANSSSTVQASNLVFANGYLWTTGLTGGSYVKFIPLAGITNGFSVTNITVPFTAYPNGGATSDGAQAGLQVGRNNIVYKATTSGLTVTQVNPGTPGSSLLAYITNTYNTGWMVGDSRLCFLSDSVSETITGTALITGDNSTFTSSAGSWATSSSWASTASATGGELQVTPGITFGRQVLPINGLTIGRSYTLTGTARLVSGTGYASLGVSSSSNGASITSTKAVFTNSSTMVAGSVTFTATATTMYAVAGDDGSCTLGCVLAFDNITCQLSDPDRSVKQLGAIAMGSITKAPFVAGGSQVLYSGFTASTNYLYCPTNSNFNAIGTGDFSVQFWANITNNSTGQYFFDLSTAGAGRLAMYHSGGTLSFGCSANGTNIATTYSTILGLHKFEMSRVSGVLTIRVDSVSVYSAANTANISNSAANLYIGVANDTTTPNLGGIGLFRISVTGISGNQSAFAYRTELLNYLNLSSVLGTTSNGIVAHGIDPDTDQLRLGTSDGLSSWSGINKVSSSSLPLYASVGPELAPSLAANATWSQVQNGWSVGSGVLTVNSATAGSTMIRDGNTGYYKTYMVTFTITSISGSGIAAAAGNATNPTLVRSVGTYTQFVRSDSAAPGVGLYAANADTVATISAISIKEVLGVTSSIASISCAQGSVYVAGNDGAFLVRPSQNLIDEMRREANGARALQRELFTIDADLSSQTTITLPSGATAKRVFLAGNLKQLGNTKDYTIVTDGYADTVTFGVSTTGWASVQANRTLS